MVTVKTIPVLAHRAAWAFANNEWPSGIIDHKNRIKFDNRPDNLRLVTPSENNFNHARGTYVAGSQERSARAFLEKFKTQGVLDFSIETKHRIQPNKEDLYGVAQGRRKPVPKRKIHINSEGYYVFDDTPIDGFDAEMGGLLRGFRGRCQE